MDAQQLHEILEGVAAGKVSVSDAQRQLQIAPFKDLGYAKVDTQRGIRQGVSEVVYGQGKTAEQIVGISLKLLQNGQDCVLITRLDADKAQLVQELSKAHPELAAFDYRDISRLAIFGNVPPAKEDAPYIAVACAGTSDLPVAEEAAMTAEVLGSPVRRLYDVGVSGIHRLLACADDIAGAACVIAVAGMEGALASAVGGLASCPVIAVPTSIGYGASFGGVAALLAMLNSCASGVSVVNIDNGFGAGYQAHLIASATKSC